MGKIVHINEFSTLNEVAKILNVKPIEIIKMCMINGVFVTAKQRLDHQMIDFIVNQFGFKLQIPYMYHIKEYY